MSTHSYQLLFITTCGATHLGVGGVLCNLSCASALLCPVTTFGILVRPQPFVPLCTTTKGMPFAKKKVGAQAEGAITLGDNAFVPILLCQDWFGAKTAFGPTLLLGHHCCRAGTAVGPALLSG